MGFNSRFDELFPTVESKAAAFDKVASKFYNGNFGTMSKSDFETLMFSLYIDQILEHDDSNFAQYSDYVLSRDLGISQSRISSLKVKKQLQYPHNFDWRDSFSSIVKNARYENGKIKIQIPDINLYYEIKHSIEENGGYVDVTLNKSLLQISPEYFFDILISLTREEERPGFKQFIIDNLQEAYRSQNQTIELITKLPLGQQIKNCKIEIIIAVLEMILPKADNTTIIAINAILPLFKKVFSCHF